ncbi:MAG: class I SAM-dependent methyltransferase [Promethearchaeota archaeon]|jgi:ubiquinone/menaquinone biosynthesis C-methylase UbiE
MNPWVIFLCIFGIIFILILIFGLPRKKSERKPSIEGFYSSEVAKAFEKMTNILPFKMLRRRIISELKKYTLNGLLVDVGCGSGNLIVEIAQKYNSIDLIGIDISDEILELAKQRAIKNELNERIKFEIGNVENLPFLDNSIDFIISSLSLHHWANSKIAFKELVRALKGDGLLLIFDFRRNSRKFFYGLLKFVTKIVAPKVLKEINEPLGSLQAGYTAEEIREILSQINIRSVEIRPFLAWMFISIKKH